MTQRPIRFRAWDLRDSVIHNVHHIEFGKDTMWVAWVTQEKPVMTYESREDDCILMQSTGLVDSKGVEIFEGDIVKVNKTTGYFDKGHRIVEYLAPTFSLCKPENIGSKPQGKFGNYVIDSDEFDTPMASEEVIGNIYENPELLTN